MCMIALPATPYASLRKFLSHSTISLLLAMPRAIALAAACDAESRMPHNFSSTPDIADKLLSS